MNLMEGLLAEMNRVRDLIPMYESIGPAGTFATHRMKQAIAEAERTISEDDVVAMVPAYQALKGFNE